MTQLPYLNFTMLTPQSASDTRFCRIPAGPFIYGPEVCYERLAHSPPFKPQQKMALSTFWLAEFPVTYRQWREFLQETGHVWNGRWHAVVRGWRGTFLRAYAPVDAYPEGHDDYPIVDVTQAEAYRYCDWLSQKISLPLTLPTEFQWEKAARGSDGRFYPWGNEKPRPDIQWQATFPVRPATYLFSLMVRPRREWARAGWYWRNGYPLPVGAIPQNVSPFGCVDMSGNIWEWTNSLYNATLPDYHGVKGGSWGYTIHHAACNVRSACSVTTPSREYRAPGTGFRVMALKEPKFVKGTA